MLNLSSERIVVTGGAGFLGHYTVEQLKKAGAHEVFVPRSKEYNLVEKEDVLKMYSDFRPSVVIHLAAVVGGIGANMKSPGEFFFKNLMMGAQLMEYGRLNKLKKFVGIGTICAYPKYAKIPFKEENLWDGYPEETNAPYGLSKKMMIVQSLAYRQQYGFNSISLLPVNLYGPRDSFDLEASHVIPAMIRKFDYAERRGEEKVVLWGDGSPTREFLYVEDCARGIVLASQKYDKPDPINLGSGMEISIKDLAEKIRGLIGYKGKILWDTSKPNGQPRRCLDVSKAEKEFGFKASVNFDEGLKRTIDWYSSTIGKDLV